MKAHLNLWMRAAVLMAVIGLCLILLPACEASEIVPDGIYSCIEADTGERYIFSGDQVRVTLYLMGQVTENHVGTYFLKDGRITFHFPTDKDGIYSKTLAFSISEDGQSITIGKDVFKRG